MTPNDLKGRSVKRSTNGAFLAILAAASLLGITVSAARADLFEDCASHEDLPRAIKACTELTKQKLPKPELSGIYVNRGGVYGLQGDCDKAIADYNKAINLDPKNASAYNNRAYCWGEEGDTKKQLADYDKAVELDPQRSIYFFNRAGVHFDAKDFDRAGADYDKAIELEPNNAVFYAHRAENYGKKGDGDHAMADLSKAIELDPGDAKTLARRASLKKVIGDRDGAIADYSKAIEIEAEDDAGADLWSRGQLYADTGQYDLAIADYTKSIDGLTEDVADFAPLVLYDRATAYINAGRHDDAIADCEAILKDDDKDASAYACRGVNRYFKGDLEAAEKDLRRSIELGPLAENMAVLYLVRKAKGDDGTAELKTNAGKLDKDASTFPIAGYFLGETSEASLLEAAKEPWQQCQANDVIGWLKQVSGDKPGAASALQQAVQVCPKGDFGLGWALALLKQNGDIVEPAASDTPQAPSDQPSPAGAGTASPSEQMELSFWDSVKDSDDPAMLQAYLDKFPNGTFASLAKIKLGKLNKQ